MFNRIKKSLLIPTALKALTCGHNAYAENLPADATNLTSGKYVVERSDTMVSHTGDINLSRITNSQLSLSNMK